MLPLYIRDIHLLYAYISIFNKIHKQKSKEVVHDIVGCVLYIKELTAGDTLGRKKIIEWVTFLYPIVFIAFNSTVKESFHMRDTQIQKHWKFQARKKSVVQVMR